MVLQHNLHPDPTLSPRALALLYRILERQPPAWASIGADAPVGAPTMSQAIQIEAATGALKRGAALC